MNRGKLQDLLDRQVRRTDVKNIVVSIESADGQSIFEGASGQADPTGARPMTIEIPYHIASVTKMYTTTLIVQLHQEGKVDLEAPAARYLPESTMGGIHVLDGRDFSRDIRLFHLVNQTSGLADYFEDSPKGGISVFDALKKRGDLRLSFDEMLEITRSIPPRARPGEKAHYSDTNYQIVGAIIEAVTGSSLAGAYQERICKPLGLQSTYLFDDRQGYQGEPPAVIYLRDKTFERPQFLASSKADGGLISTARESLIFLRAFFEGGLFDQEILARMMEAWNAIFFPVQYGLGLMRFKLPRIFSPFSPPPEFIGHSGATGSFAFYHPEKAVYLAGTVNQISNPGRPFQLMSQLVGVLD